MEFIQLILSISIVTYLKYSSLLFISTTVLEHVARKREFNTRPSTLFWFVEGWFSWLFYKIGSYIATISSFLYHIDFADFLTTLHELTEPLFRLLVSPCQMFLGYVETARTYLTKEALIYLGSFLLLIFVFWITCYWFQFDLAYYPRHWYSENIDNHRFVCDENVCIWTKKTILESKKH